jgi:phenylacetate-CoA ligase
MSKLESLYKKSPLFLQTLFLNMKAVELYFERYGRKFWKVFEEFDRNQWLSESEIDAYQDEKLRALICHAYDSVPYYNEVMRRLKLKPEDVRGKVDLHKLPVLRRSDVKNHSSKLMSTKYPKWLLRHGHTSGTTGSPLDFFYDIRTCVVHHVADWRQKYWAGLKFDQPFASLQGRMIVPLEQEGPPFWRKNYINNQLFLSSFHLREKNIPYYLEKLKQDDIKFIEGYPSTVYILALYLEKHQLKFPLHAVLTSSETLFDYQRETIEDAFACRVFDFYGMAERVVFATECTTHSGHHLNSDYGITEFLDSRDEPVTNGRLGKIVATSLYNYAMPFIRYETNDSCAVKTEKCPCGRAFLLMEDVATKNESIISLPDGRLISPSVLTHPFKPMKNVIESQIVQETIDQLNIKIVRTEKYSKDDERQLCSAFKERLGVQMKIDTEYVDSIPRTGNGKLKWVVSKIKPQF